MKKINPASFKLSNKLKRLLDIMISIIVITFFLPVLFLAGMIIYILEGRPIFYLSDRAISATKVIQIRKFRTMVKDALSNKYRLEERYMKDGYLDIPLNCEVYTSVGRILERTQVVELFQLLNILKNEMSFVGNRPLPVKNLELLKKFPNWKDRFASPCGITGISQITGKHTLTPAQRLNLEISYSSLFINPKGNILKCDFFIIYYTFRLLLTGQYIKYDHAIQILIRCGANINI